MSPQKEEEAVRASLKLLSDIDYDIAPVDVSISLHDLLMEMGTKEDPYIKLKKESTRKALEILPDMESKLNGSVDRLRLAAMMAIAGNVVDYGAANELDLEETLMSAVEEGLGIDDMEFFRKDLQMARNITYYLDNSGEVVFDLLFIREIRRIRPDIKVTLYAKRRPLLNDVTIEDVLEAGYKEQDGLELKELEHEGWVDPEDIKNVDNDIIISKGQGNYESLSESNGLYFMMVVKCDVVSQDLGVGIGEMVFKKK